MSLSSAWRRTICCSMRQGAPCPGCHILRHSKKCQPVPPVIRSLALSHETRNYPSIEWQGMDRISSQRRSSSLNFIRMTCSSNLWRRYKCTHPKIPASEMPVEEWIHPDDREEGPVTRDSELKALLKELVSDFKMEDDQKEEKPGEDDAIINFEGVVVGKRTEGTEQQTKAVHKRTKRGLSPVFSLEDISELLQEENASDVCVISVPPERGYVDYFIVVTARSTRHLIATTQSINKAYKERKSKKHPFVIIEGRDSDDWQCIDFGNIVVHFMLADVRELYELEKLWLLGPEYDEQFQRMQRYQDSLRQALTAPISEQEG